MSSFDSIGMGEFLFALQVFGQVKKGWFRNAVAQPLPDQPQYNFVTYIQLSCTAGPCTAIIWKLHENDAIKGTLQDKMNKYMERNYKYNFYIILKPLAFPGCYFSILLENKLKIHLTVFVQYQKYSM